ncbi:MAG: hypothetical protein ACI9SE_004599 [Neolewinella sp.]|jgi:hypothetical protein
MGGNRRHQRLPYALGLAPLLLAWACQKASQKPSPQVRAAKELAQLRAETEALDANNQQQKEIIKDLQNQLRLGEPRVAAYLELEYLGSQPTIPGPARTFEILSTSKTPDPKSSDYLDCIVVRHCELCDDDGNKTGSQSLVAMVVFHNRKLTPAASFRVGTLVRAQLVPWNLMPASVQSIQRVDETDIYDQPMFAAIGPTADYEQTLVKVTPPDGKAPSQSEAIAAAIKINEERMAPHGSFAKWHTELQPVRRELAEQRRAAKGPISKDRRFVFRNLSYIDHEPNAQWPSPQIAYFTNLRDQLAAMGIDLIVAPFPEQENISALAFLAKPPTDEVVFAGREQWHLALLKAGIEVIDLRPAFVEALKHHQHVFYDAEDGHPANGAIITAAHEIAKRLRRYKGLKASFQTVQTRDIQFAIPVRHKKFPAHAYAAKCYTATSVTDVDGTSFLLDTADAPVLLVGDSFATVPYFYGVLDGDITAHMTKETGVMMRKLQVGGAAPQLMVHLARAGRQRTKGVTVLVYVFRENYMFTHDEANAKFRWQITELPR